jgi:hypothetical protein
MPQFKVKAPDGHTILVNAPEGGTEAQAIAYAQANDKPDPEAMKSLATSKAASEKLDTAIATGADNPNNPTAEMGGLERFIGGAGAGVRGKLLGARQFVNDITGGRVGDRADWRRRLRRRNASTRICWQPPAAASVKR